MQRLCGKHLHGKPKLPVEKSNGWQNSIWELQKYWVSFEGMQVLHLFQSAQLIQVYKYFVAGAFSTKSNFVVKCLSSLTAEKEHAVELLR